MIAQQFIGGVAGDGQQILITQQIGDPQSLLTGLAGAEDFAGAAQL
jgi:hypothetical protein